MRPAKPTWADGAVMPLNLDAWWNEPEYKVCGTFQTRGYFILRKLHELDPARVPGSPQAKASSGSPPR